MPRISIIPIIVSFAIGCHAAACGTAAPDSAQSQLRMNPTLAVGAHARVDVAPSGLRYRPVGARSWSVAREGAALISLSRVNAPDGGVLHLALPGADHGATLWLGQGADVVLDQTAGVPVRVHLVAGRARLACFGVGLRCSLRGDRADRDVSGGDVVLSRPTAGAALAVTSTMARPSLADWSVALDSPDTPAGIGTLTVRGGEPLILRALHVRASLAGDHVDTEVEHVFFNPSDTLVEGTFRFPLPDGASLTGLAMEVDGKLMEGELVERKKAREIYEEIVDSMRDPALLEWEEGNVFKLRVFPIEGKQPKRVVLRYLSPLRQSPEGARFVYETAAPGMQARVDRFTLRFDGRTILDESGFRAGRDVVVDIPAGRLPAGPSIERRTDASYLTLTLRPDFTGVPANARSGPRRLILLLDTSRSALESRDLILASARAALAGLRPGDRFRLATADVVFREHTRGFEAPIPDTIDRVLREVAVIVPDGASDVGRSLTTLARLAVGPKGQPAAQVLYIGDGTPTWGQTDPAVLEASLSRAFESVSLSALVLGKGADGDLLARIAGRSGGRTAAPRTPVEVSRFLLRMEASLTGPALRDVRVATPANTTLLAATPSVLSPGDALSVLLRIPAGSPIPTHLSLTARAGARPVSQSIPLGTPVAAPQIARRFGTALIGRLEAQGAERERIVEASLAYGVMSRHTSFLVLESEEAYERHKIERKKKAEREGGPTVTGGDLESLGGPEASLHPDNIQPGDPELRIPAPRDARQVVVVFPFGETKLAEWESELGLWTARFLIDKDTVDGTYRVLVRITHADGRVQTLELAYTVDTQAPAVTVTMRPDPARRGRFILEATEVVQSLDAGGGPAVRVAEDVYRLEARAPDGRTLRFRRVSRGVWQARWTPRSAPSGAVKLRIVVGDSAGNRKSTMVMTLPAAGAVR